jgi:hypothetical protein
MAVVKTLDGEEFEGISRSTQLVTRNGLVDFSGIEEGEVFLERYQGSPMPGDAHPPIASPTESSAPSATPSSTTTLAISETPTTSAAPAMSTPTPTLTMTGSVTPVTPDATQIPEDDESNGLSPTILAAIIAAAATIVAAIIAGVFRFLAARRTRPASEPEVNEGGDTNEPE